MLILKCEHGINAYAPAIRRELVQRSPQRNRKLDEAVFAAYGWPATLTDDEILARLLELNLKRAG
jgi:hypothetical protein